MNGLTEQPSFLIFVSFLAIKLHNQPVKGLEKRMTTFHLIDCYSQRQQGHDRQARYWLVLPLSLSLSLSPTTWKSRSCDRISRCGHGFTSTGRRCHYCCSQALKIVEIERHISFISFITSRETYIGGESPQI